jgi:PAS domain S-box-containing protein
VLSGETRVFQATRLRKDGGRVAVEISGAPIRSPSGRVLGISTIHRDVTLARGAALADARFAAAVSASLDAIITLGPDGEVESWNRGAEELFGWTAEEVSGKPLTFLVPDDRAREYDEILKRIQTGEAVAIETVRVAKDGRRVAVSASFTPFLGGDAHAGTAVTFRDIGDRVQREAHVHLLLKELSHRSKNLLAVVQGIARQSAMRANDFKNFVDNFGARLRALAHSHDLLVQENWHGADMHALVRAQTGAFEIAPDVVRIRGERLLVKPEAAQNIGLSLHELASNALRHGALSTPDGSVDIAWAMVERGEGRALQLTWRETGGPEARLPRRGGFGLLVVSQITPRALGGSAVLSVDEGGLSWTLEVPAENVLGQT